MPEEKERKGNPTFDLLGTASVMGMHMVSGPIVGAGLGYLVDTYVFSSWPYASAIGLVLGIVAGFRNVFADARHLQKIQDKIDEDNK